MRLLLDILQGAGVSAAAGIRPFLPGLLTGALASADLGVDFDGTDFAFLEAPWFLALLAVGLVVSVLVRRVFEQGPGEAALVGIGIGLGGAAVRRARSTTASTSGGPGLIGGIACACARLRGDARRSWPRVRTRLDAQAAGGAAAVPRGRRGRPGRRVRALPAARPRWRSPSSAASTPPGAAARARSTPACASCARWRAPAQARPRGHRRHEALDARAGDRDRPGPGRCKRVIERGTYVDGCTAAFPSVTPVCAATIATGARQDEHRIPSMNW